MVRKSGCRVCRSFRSPSELHHSTLRVHSFQSHPSPRQSEKYLCKVADSTSGLARPIVNNMPSCR